MRKIHWHPQKVVMWLSLAVLLALGVAARKFETPEQKQSSICRETPVPPHLNTSISGDGKVIAVLSHVDNCGRKRVRYKNVAPEGPWQELSIPMGVDSIRFGLKGHELMITRRVRPGEGTMLGELNKVDSWGELYKVDLDHPETEPQTIYEAYGVTHPVEVTPGMIMVQNCVTTPDKRCHSKLGWQWDLIKDGELIHRWPYGGAYGNRGNMNFGWPNVVPGQGAFWLKIGGYYKDGDTFPSYWSLAFPGKASPQFNLPLEVGTVALQCDYKMERCLRVHLKGSYKVDELGSPQTSIPGPYTYMAGTVYRNASCLTQEIAGFLWEESITPDGRAAVLSFASHGESKPHIVVLEYQPEQCEPTFIHHIYLEEK